MKNFNLLLIIILANTCLSKTFAKTWDYQQCYKVPSEIFMKNFLSRETDTTCIGSESLIKYEKKWCSKKIAPSIIKAWKEEKKWAFKGINHNRNLCSYLVNEINDVYDESFRKSEKINIFDLSLEQEISDLIVPLLQYEVIDIPSECEEVYAKANLAVIIKKNQKTALMIYTNCKNESLKFSQQRKKNQKTYEANNIVKNKVTTKNKPINICVALKQIEIKSKNNNTWKSIQSNYKKAKKLCKKIGNNRKAINKLQVKIKKQNIFMNSDKEKLKTIYQRIK